MSELWEEPLVTKYDEAHLRIVYLAPFDLRLPAGHTSHVLATVKQMTFKDHAVTLISGGCPKDVDEMLHSMAVKITDYSGLKSVSFGFLSAIVLAREIWRSKPNVIYTRYFKSALLPILVARMHGVPVVLEMNSDLANERKANHRGRLGSTLEAFEERALIRLASATVAVTKAIAENIEKVVGHRPSRVSVIGNGVDTKVFTSIKRSECAARHGLNVDRKRIVFTGAFQVWQGALDLLAAMKIVVRRRSDVDLILVGDGPLRQEIERRVEEFGLRDRVWITGYVSEDKVAELISASDVCAAPYNSMAASDSETEPTKYGALMGRSPLKLYSYLACGLPIVSSHFRESGAYIEEVGAGIAVAPGNPEMLAAAILDVLDDPIAARKMGETGYRIAKERHDWSVVVDAYIELIQAVVRKKDSKREP